MAQQLTLSDLQVRTRGRARAVEEMAQTRRWAAVDLRQDPGGPRRRVPLAIGVREQLLPLLESGQEKKLQHALRTHCKSRPYLAELSLDQGFRYNVDGSEFGDVRAEDRYAAAVLLQYELEGDRMKNASDHAAPGASNRK